MDDDSRFGQALKWGLGAVGLGAVAAFVFLPRGFAIWVVLAILILFILLFGGYYLWRRRRAKRQSSEFTNAVEAQAAAAPKAISDPNKRASLDSVRRKFQTGLQEFKNRGKDIYKLPWYVIIGESGSGKTEAIRHSGIDFPPGLQDELQGSGGTVNMDWWFTNRGIILDTAGSMLFDEARTGESAEWREFLRLLKRARPHCPVNGLFLVLSVESLIRDSADTIAQKASRLAQQLDLIQRALDVRFPVYLLVTKCDLLIGFREFFDSIDDPLLQHQMFGWSNPDPLDSHFRPDMVEQHLQSVAARLRRRRMALIRDVSGTGRLGDTSQFFASTYQLGRGPATSRRLDEVDGLFTLPESVMRLAPRLRRYLETIFVAGEWSAKPVFLRGIYFTSSMREGKALDEAIAQATGLGLDQLPDERSWEKNRAFFLRDLFHEKVFRESGLVTRATNTLKLLRQRQFAIFGTATLALLVLLGFAIFAYRSFDQSVGKEANLWQAGANPANWNQGEWSPPLVRLAGGATLAYVYGGDDPVPGLPKFSVVGYQKELRRIVEKPLRPPLIFRPISWLLRPRDEGRPEAQRLLFEGGVLGPLVARTRDKMQKQEPRPGDRAGLDRHRDALLTLIQIEADGIAASKDSLAAGNGQAEKYLGSLLSYLIETNCVPDTNLVETFSWTYDSRRGGSAGQWPPATLVQGNSLAKNPVISAGLDAFQRASAYARSNIESQVTLLNEVADRLREYNQAEVAWLGNSAGACDDLTQVKAGSDAAWQKLQAAGPAGAPKLISLAGRYAALQTDASKASASVLSQAIGDIQRKLPPPKQSSGLLLDIQSKLKDFAAQAGAGVRTSFEARSSWLPTLDSNCLLQVLPGGKPAFELRSDLYAKACALVRASFKPDDAAIGNEWKRFSELQSLVSQFGSGLAAYKGPLSNEVVTTCQRLAASAEQKLKNDYVDDYAAMAGSKLRALISSPECSMGSLTNARNLCEGLERDLAAAGALGDQAKKLEPLRQALPLSRQALLEAVRSGVQQKAVFPYVSNAATPMDAAGVIALKDFLAQLDGELANATWTKLPAGSSILGSLKSDVQYFRAVAKALVVEGKPNDTLANFKLAFIPQEMKEGSDLEFTKVFRWMTVGLGAQTGEEKEVTSQGSQPLELGQGSLDAGITIAFRDLAGHNVKKAVGNWAFFKLLHEGKPDSPDDGKTWRIRLNFPEAKIESKGVVFELRLDQPLPKTWPK